MRFTRDILHEQFSTKNSWKQIVLISGSKEETFTYAMFLLHRAGVGNSVHELWRQGANMLQYNRLARFISLSYFVVQKLIDFLPKNFSLFYTFSSILWMLCIVYVILKTFKLKFEKIYFLLSPCFMQFLWCATFSLIVWEISFPTFCIF